MNRPLLIRSSKYPYHVTNQCWDRDFFPLPLSEIWIILTDLLYETHKKFDLCIHSFVLMGNHFHLLCHTPKANLDDAMRFFSRESSIRISKKSSKKYLWIGRYRWSLIDSQMYYYQVYRYIYQNPVRANIVKKVEDYKFSTIKTLVPFPLHTAIPMTFGGHEGEYLWLNQKYDEEDRKLIKLGLRKNQFDINKRKLKAFKTRMSLLD